jgi:hypothetical protein
MIPLTSDELLLHMTPEALPGVYVLGHHERRLTVFSQQVRALNLIYALFKRRVLQRGASLAVVGGGVAGLAAAGAVKRLGCLVTVLEQKSLLHIFQGNRTRWIHPHLYDWPQVNSERSEAGLPILNWHADAAVSVERQIRAAWRKLQEDFGTIKCDEGIKHIVLTFPDGVPTVEWSPPGSKAGFAAVILAVGFGVEKGFTGVPYRSYWQTDDLERGDIRPEVAERRILISGTGDGGLTDLLRARLNDFDHERTFKHFIEHIGPKPLKAHLLSIEKALPSSPEELTRAYDDLDPTLFRKVDAWLARQLRDNTRVVLNGTSDYILSPKSSVLNRLLAYRLCRVDERLTYEPGDLSDAEPLLGPEGYHVTVKNGGSRRSLDGLFNEIVIRHGADNALEKSFPDVAKHCVKLVLYNEQHDKSRFPMWKPLRFFGDVVAPMIPSHPMAPTPKDWCLVQPYGDIPDFVGRELWLDTLSDWLEKDAAHSVFILRALPGLGKSALAWYWLTNYVNSKQWPRVVWWSFSKNDSSFDRFVSEALAYLSDAEHDVRSLGPRECGFQLAKIVERSHVLLILDGFENVLTLATKPVFGPDAHAATRVTSEEDRFRCLSVAGDEFLRSCAKIMGGRGKVLLTSQVRPTALETDARLRPGCREKELPEWQEAEAVAFFRQKQGIVGSSHEIRRVCRHYGYHPLKLYQLARLIVNEPKKQREEAEISLTLTTTMSNSLLDQILGKLTPLGRRLLGRIACLRADAPYSLLESTTPQIEEPQQLRTELNSLVNHRICPIPLASSSASTLTSMSMSRLSLSSNTRSTKPTSPSCDTWRFLPFRTRPLSRRCGSAVI